METESSPAWSDVYEGMRILWQTPSFVKRGKVLRVKGRSMKVRFDGEGRDTVIPDARWYWAQAKLGDRQNRMVAVRGKGPRQTEQLVLPSDGDLISTAEACGLFGIAPKELRRWLRAGKVEGHQPSGSSWQVSASSLGRFLADRD